MPAADPLLDPNDRVRAVVDRFIYRDDARAFGIAAIKLEVDGRQQEQIAKGALWGLSEGEQVELVGRWVEDPRWGRQFRVETARPLLPDTSAGIAEFIARSGVKGVGPKVAERIVVAFGDKTLDVIRDEPERLREVSGVGKRRQQAIAEAVQARLEQASGLVFLYGLGVGAAAVRRIVQRYGEDAVRTVRERPWSLAREVAGIGFRTADRIARNQGKERDDPARMLAGVLHALQELANRGDTAPARHRVIERAAELLGASPADTAEAATSAARAGFCERIVLAAGGAERLALRPLYVAEEALGRDLERLAASHGAPLSDGERDSRLHLAALALGFGLQGTQRAAVVQALGSGLMVVTGGPGTGKTTIVQGLLAASDPDKAEIALCAPTGRAARRLSESTGREAKTVHRLLEFDPRGEGFLRDRDNPLEADLVICDESSMLDVRLAASLCAAIPKGGRLLLVGDSDQLPSVGPGAVLHDVITSDLCPVVRLDRIYRQASRSLIVQSAHDVRRGERPVGARDPSGDFFIVHRDRPDAILQTVLEVVCQRLPGRYGYDPVDDIQVLVPVHRGEIGTEALNRALRARLNPGGEDVGGGLRVGDKIIQSRNNYDLEVYNGDVGRVVAKAAGHVQVRFGRRIVDVPPESLEDLRLAYAITVHKSQGSEYPAVVVPLHGQHYMLLQRNLLYTAITRARRFAVLIGQPQAIGRAVRNATPVRRSTLLRHLLQGAATKVLA